MASDDDTDSDSDKVNLSDDLGVPMNPMKNTLVLAFSFLCIFTAYVGILDIQSSINQEVGLGVVSLSFIYAIRIVASIFTPIYIHFVGLKTTFVVSFICLCIYTLSNVYPSWWTLIPSSILVGFNLSQLWIACHLYVIGMGQYSSQFDKLDLHSSLSRYSGIFSCIVSFSHVSGNFISSVILHQSSIDQSDLNQTRICGADDCPGNLNETTKIVRPDTEVIDILMCVYMACGLTGLFTTGIFLRPLKLEKTDQKRLLRKAVSCFMVFKDKKLLCLIPVCLAQAVYHMILHTGFTKAFVSCSVGVKMVGYVMMTNGLVVSLSAFSFGHIAKYTGRRFLLGLAFTIDIITLSMLLLWKPVPEETYLLFVMPCIWAIADGIWGSQTSALTAMSFPNKQPAVFSNLGCWWSVGFTTVLVTDRLVCLRTKFYASIVLWGMAVIGYILLEVQLSKDQQTANYQRFEEDVNKDSVQLDDTAPTKED